MTVPLRLFDGETLLPPGSVRTQAGGVYQVFTPFGRAARAQLGPVRPLAAPQNLNPAPPLDGFEVPIPTLEGARNPAVLAGGEGAALARATRFFDERVHAYDAARDIPSQPGTSRISQDLKFGTISVRTVWAMAADLVGESAHRFQNEILWREFAYHTLAARPGLLERPFRSDWEGFAWVSDPAGWEAWTQGRTGYPIVDAAARQLLEEGFVHNRARMIAASFLCKHLMIDYRDGEAHYLRWLTDGDPAQNNLGWQWSAGCGCDAQPYFRVFNPISQGKKFDADGEYVRRYVPELARMPKRYIHAPWQAPISVQEAFGVRIGRDYPAPVVEHALARRAFLDTAKRHLVRARAMAS